MIAEFNFFCQNTCCLTHVLYVNMFVTSFIGRDKRNKFMRIRHGLVVNYFHYSKVCQIRITIEVCIDPKSTGPIHLLDVMN
jgi:hypothetical protein